MTEILFHIVALGLILTFWICGLRIVSGEGMILHPIQKWFLSFGLSRRRDITIYIKEKEKELKEAIRAGAHTDAYMYQRIIDKQKMEKLKLDWWHKPLFTCGPCMCSVHGVLVSVYFAWLTTWETLYLAPFSMLMAVVAVTLTLKKVQ